jgi:hypothetical protein
MHKCLGKKPPRHDYRTLYFGKYAKALPEPPKSCKWDGSVSNFPMLLNDQIGDCTIAGALHQTQTWSDNAGNIFVPTNNDALVAYEAVSGYNPQTHENDDGCDLLTVLKYWKNNGIGAHKISAFVEIEPANINQIKQSIALLGGVYAGFALPKNCENQEEWHITSQGTHGDGAIGSLGGHCVNIIDYDASGLTCVSWGNLLRLTWTFLKVYMDEAYAVLSPDWIEKNNLSPSGFDAQTLLSDLNDL